MRGDQKKGEDAEDEMFKLNIPNTPEDYVPINKNFAYCNSMNLSLLIEIKLVRLKEIRL